MPSFKRTFVNGIAIEQKSVSTNSLIGEMEVLSDGRLYYFDTINDKVVTAQSTDTLINKSMDGGANTFTNLPKSSIPSDVVYLAATQTLTNKTINGPDNTLTNIANSSLVNSAVTVNGSTVSLGGAIVITADTTNALTIGTGLTGTSFDGSAPVTITIDSTVVTLSGTQTLTNKTLTSPTIATILNGGTLTLPTSTDTLVGRATTDTLTHKTLTSAILNSSSADSIAAIGSTISDISGNLNITSSNGVILNGASSAFVQFQQAGTPIAFVNTGSFTIVNQHSVDFRELASNGTTAVSIRGPASLASSYTITLPNAAPTSNTVLAYDGTNYNWSSLSGTTIPAGLISPYGGASAPTGYLLCDGSAVSRTTYSALFAAISTTFGSGDGSTTFNLPDLRGIFPRGAGTNGILSYSTGGGAGGASVGAYQNDASQGHSHTVTTYANVGAPNGGGANVQGWTNFNTAGQAGIVSVPVTDGTNGTPRTTNETRPFNVAVNYIIKT
jgi:microcystin-dependent protein